MAGGWFGNVYLGDEADERVQGSSRAERIYGEGGDDRLFGGGGNDQLYGGGGTNGLHGQAGNDRVFAGPGDFVASGGSGRDRLVVDLAGRAEDARVALSGDFAFAGGSASGFETFAFYGGLGDDRIRGWHGDDVLNGRQGRDTLKGGGGDDILSGGEGFDILYGGAGGDIVYGGVTVDPLPPVESPGMPEESEGSGRFLAYGGAGIDTLFLNFATDTRAVRLALSDAFVFRDGAAHGFEIFDVFGSDGDDLIAGASGDDTLVGSAGSDALRGGGGDDRIVTGLGPGDTRDESRLAGNDVAHGGAGDDSLTGGLGRDRLHGGAGDDVFELRLDRRADTIRGGAGEDALFVEWLGDGSLTARTGANGAVEVTVDGARALAASGIDGVLVYGGAAADRIALGAGDDTMSGGGGLDTLDGGAGFDVVDYLNAPGALRIALDGDRFATAEVGGAAADRVRNAEAVIGSDFDDVIRGDAADNWLDGGFNGSDRLTGGAGADRFGLQPFEFLGIDRITDFDASQDTISIGFNGHEMKLGHALDGGAFRIGLQARDADDRVLYDRATGWLLFDEDGSGALAAHRIARLEAGLDLTADHFFLHF